MSVAEQPKRELSQEQQAQNNLRGWLSSPSVIDQLKMVLPKHLTPDRFVRVVLTASIKKPLLLQCTKESIWMSVLNAAATGLEMDGYEGHLIPYNNYNKALGKKVYEAQFQSDYKGLVKLAYQSEMVRAINARGVYSGDEFKYKLGTKQFVDHIPCEDPKHRGTLKFAYAICELSNGGEPLVVLNRAEVMAHKACSKSAGSSDSPWNKPETEPAMWAKSAFRELSKFIPRSSLLQRALQIEQDEELNFGREPPIIIHQDEYGGNDEQAMLPEPTKSESLTEQLEAARFTTEARKTVPVRSKPESAPVKKPAANGTHPAAGHVTAQSLLRDIDEAFEEGNFDGLDDDITLARSETKITHDDAKRLRQHLSDMRQKWEAAQAK